MYGAETWTLDKTREDKINAFEMWVYRKMLRISYTDHVTNEEVLRRVGEKRSFLKTIHQRKLQYFGHLTRQNGLQRRLLERK